MGHAAYMRDDDLFPRAAEGDGEALLVLVARHGSRVRALVADMPGARAATAATAHAFAALATGTLPPDDTAWPARLAGAALAAAGDPAIATGRDDANILAALLALLPEPQRAALLDAQDRASANSADTTPLPPLPAPPQAAPGGVPPLLALPTLPPAFPAREPAPIVRRGRLDRYVPPRPAARWLVPLAILAVICAYWVGRGGVPEVPPTPTLVAGWPTLPPRATREVARLEPTPGATQGAPLPVPAMPPTPTAAYGPMSGVIATGVAAPPVTVAPPEATPSEAPPPTAPLATATVATAAVPIPTSLVPVARAPQPTAPPLPTAPPPARPVPTATASVPPPTAQASTPTVAPTVATPTTAQLALKTQALGFGVELGPRALVFSNPGTGPLTWRAVADSTWLDLAQASGTLRAGETQSVAINIARGDLPTGGYTGAVQVVSNGGDGVVPVTMAISPSNTVVSAFAEPSVPLGALGCAAPNTYLVSAEIVGNGMPKRAVVYYAIDGGTQQTQDLNAQGRRYSATLGPFSEPGNVVYSLVITEADGNVVRSAPNTLTITDCPSRVRTVPVVPPATQPFTLAPGGRNIYTFNTVAPGSLVVTIAWQGDATRLSTLLYSPQRPAQPFEQRAGEKTLTFTFPVSAADIAAGGDWALHLVNYESGAATGRLEIAFVPPGAPTPTSQGTPRATTPTTTAAPTATPIAPTAIPTVSAPTTAPTATPTTSTPAPASPPATPATRPTSGTPKP